MLLQLHLGQLCACGMLVVGACEAGPRLSFEQFQEGGIAVRPPIQAAEVCGICNAEPESSFHLHSAIIFEVPFEAS